MNAKQILVVTVVLSCGLMNSARAGNPVEMSGAGSVLMAAGSAAAAAGVVNGSVQVAGDSAQAMSKLTGAALESSGRFSVDAGQVSSDFTHWGVEPLPVTEKVITVGPPSEQIDDGRAAR